MFASPFRSGLVLLYMLCFGIAMDGHAESPAQSVHWGSIAFPDHDQTLTLGMTVVDRFTEFDGEGKRYNNIRETMGFNFFTVSWTRPLARFPGWNFNFTAGGGPTRNGPSRFLQTDVVHKFRDLTPVPVGAKREVSHSQMDELDLHGLFVAAVPDRPAVGLWPQDRFVAGDLRRATEQDHRAGTRTPRCDGPGCQGSAAGRAHPVCLAG